ncbi:MAG: nitrate/nitrite transporter NrtS [Paracoccaceae bacterium]
MKFRTAKEYIELSITDGTPRKAFLTACVVGTILTAINHWETLLIGEYPPITKVILTYCVPYVVTTWGSVLGKLSRT